MDCLWHLQEKFFNKYNIYCYIIYYKMKHFFKKLNASGIAALDSTMTKPSIIYGKIDNQIRIFDTNDGFCIKLKYNGDEYEHIFSAKSYALDDENLIAAIKYEPSENRGFYKFSLSDLENPVRLYKKKLDETNKVYNYALMGAIGIDNNGINTALSFPYVTTTDGNMHDPYYTGIIQSINQTPSNVWRTIDTSKKDVQILGINGERLHPHSKLYVYDGYTYFAAYEYGIEGVENNRAFRYAYICRTNDMVNFQTKPILDVTSNLGSISSISDAKLQITEPDMVIREDGKAYFVIRCGGDYSNSTDLDKRNAGYFYGEINNVSTYFNAIDNYPLYDFQDIDDNFSDTRVYIKYVDCNEITVGGHLKGVIPHIFLHNGESRVILYSRCIYVNGVSYAHNQIYYIPSPTNIDERYKIGKAHNGHGNHNSPQGGNMGVSVFGNYLSILCPHDRSRELCCFFIPLQSLGENDFLETLVDIENNSTQIEL